MMAIENAIVAGKAVKATSKNHFLTKLFWLKVKRIHLLPLSSVTINFVTMKQILALLLAVCTMSVAMAQSGGQHRNSRDVILGQTNRNSHDTRYGRYSFTEREREAQVIRIRHQFRDRIRDVRRNRYIRNGEKHRQIRLLELQRDREIRRINEYFRDKRNIHYNNGHRNNNCGNRNTRRY